MRVVYVRDPYCRRRRRYGLGHFLFDLVMLSVTGGLWIIWIIIRELRNASAYR